MSKDKTVKFRVNKFVVPSLQIFDHPDVQSSVKSLAFDAVQPSVPLDNTNSTINFNYESKTPHYVDLSRSYIKLRWYIEKKDKADIANDKLWVPINNFINAQFSDIDISFNETKMKQHNSNYGMKSFIKILEQTKTSSKENYNRDCLMFEYDQGPAREYYRLTVPTGAELRTEYSGGNTSIEDRWDIVSNGKKIVSRLYVLEDVWDTGLLILPSVDLGLTLTRSSNEYIIKSKEPNYQVKIEKIEWYLCKVVVDDSVCLSHTKTLQLSPAIYPFKRYDISTFLVPSGILQHTWRSRGSLKIGHKCLFGLVSHASTTGHHRKNPFNFTLENVSSYSLYVGGLLHTNRSTTVDIAGGDFIDPYLAFQEFFGNTTSISEYGAMLNLMCFNFKIDGKFINEKEIAELRLDIEFKTEYALPMSLIFLHVTDSSFQINADKFVTFEDGSA
jgi:hypothetical protein